MAAWANEFERAGWDLPMLHRGCGLGIDLLIQMLRCGVFSTMRLTFWSARQIFDSTWKGNCGNLASR